MNLRFNYKNIKNIVGCDEAGRGCLAGPVVAAAVMLARPIKGLRDSKKLSKSQREALKLEIEKSAISFSVAFIDNYMIDEINILNASILGMHHALDKIIAKPALILVDGNRFKPYKDIAHETIIKGDDKFQCIAAASILAKTYRDQYMEEMHLQYPHYLWDKNAGYPTIAHRKAIKEFGTTPLHRLTFKLLADEK